MSDLGKRMDNYESAEPRAGGTCMYICKKICQANGELRCACPSYHPDYTTLKVNSQASYVESSFNSNFGTDTY